MSLLRELPARALFKEVDDADTEVTKALSLLDANFIADYSNDPLQSTVRAPAGKIAHVSGLTVLIEGSGSLRPNRYTNQKALATGILVDLLQDGAVTGSLVPAPIRTIGHLRLAGFTPHAQDLASQANRTWVGFLPVSVYLDGNSDHAIGVTFNDNFKKLKEHRWVVHAKVFSRHGLPSGVFSS